MFGPHILHARWAAEKMIKLHASLWNILNVMSIRELLS